MFLPGEGHLTRFCSGALVLVTFLPKCFKLTYLFALFVKIPTTKFIALFFYKN